MGREDVVQVELSRKYVFQDMCCVGRIISVWISAENVLRTMSMRLRMGVGKNRSRIWRRPNATSPFAFNAARAYKTRFRTKRMSSGRRLSEAFGDDEGWAAQPGFVCASGCMSERMAPIVLVSVTAVAINRLTPTTELVKRS